MTNQYYLCLQYQPDPIAWDLFSPPPGRTVHERYFGGVFRTLDRLLGPQGLTVYLTWNLETLPTTGQDVVAVVMGDEWARVPLYSDAVQATFKCYGTRLGLGVSGGRPSLLSALTVIKYVRDQGHRLPSLWARARTCLRGEASLPAIFPIPLGYANQIELPVTPFFDRQYDLQFAGSVAHNDTSSGLRRWLRSPKVLSREQMLSQLATYREHHSQLRYDVFVTDGFGPHAAEWGIDQFERMRDAEAYSRTLMDARICLVPRGTSLETFRFFEGLRAGCVLITETLPSRWFYDGAPIIQVSDWQHLPGILDDLIRDPELLYEYHQASMDWWATVCSEEAVGTYMAEVLEALPHRSKSPTALAAPQP